jgi:hypothetical protein
MKKMKSCELGPDLNNKYNVWLKKLVGRGGGGATNTALGNEKYIVKLIPDGNVMKLFLCTDDRTK